MHSRSYGILCLACASLFFVGCDKKQEEAEEVRPVRYLVIQDVQHQDAALVTGQVAAHVYVNAAFRLSGQVAERAVSAGSAVTAGQVLARLNDSVEKNTLTAAQAEATAAHAAVDQTESLEKRAAVLLRAHAVSQNEYDDVLRQTKAARAQLDAAEAKTHIAEEQLSYTILKAEADGIVTDRLAEVGEVVAAGQPVLRLAQNKELDAVFDMPEDIVRGGLVVGRKMEACLDRQRDICAAASVYEVAPEADPVTRTYRTKALFEQPPEAMLLGATLIGKLSAPDDSSIRIPATALTTVQGKPAVWLVDPQTQKVAIRSIEIARYTTDEVVVANGLTAGDYVVTAGVQALHQDQKVKISGEGHDKP